MLSKAIGFTPHRNKPRAQSVRLQQLASKVGVGKRLSARTYLNILFLELHGLKD